MYKKNHYLTFDHDFVVKVTQYVVQYPLHHVTYSATNIEVDPWRYIYKKVTDAQMEGGTDGH